MADDEIELLDEVELLDEDELLDNLLGESEPSVPEPAPKRFKEPETTSFLAFLAQHCFWHYLQKTRKKTRNEPGTRFFFISLTRNSEFF